MSEQEGFALWLTGLPASGKSSIARELVKQLHGRHVSVVVLESDEMRKILTPVPTYSEGERSQFYRALVLIGTLITRSGINVIFDATANKREYRDRARQEIHKFVEVYVVCPQDICVARDPKGIYAQAALNIASNVPGIQAAYEPPLSPELTLDGQAQPASEAARIIDDLQKSLYI
jgi:adenylylsulfate kinase